MSRLMKINAPSTIGAAGATRRGDVAAAPGFVLPDMGARAAATAAAGGPAALANVGALLALQGVEDPAERKRRAARRADDLLGQLDDLRVAILGGGVSRAQVARLAQTLRERVDAVDDPPLQALLDDVELRAEVELAKLERAL
jgi:hypothetical protein